MQIFRRIKRIFDSRPVACHLYVTEQCNLHCGYCTEFDNTIPHPDLATVKRWVDKLADLGCMRIGIQGGEPLKHPDIVEIVRYIKSKKMGCSMSSNAFLLTPELVAGLEDAGLDSIHVSIDSMDPTESTKKCIRLVEPKLMMLRASKIPLHLTSVLFKESLPQLPEVFAWAREKGLSIKAHLIHAGTAGEYTVEQGDRKALGDFIDWQIREKKNGRNIRTMFNVLRYQKNLTEKNNYRWKCLAGYKFLFVSARGEFWLCSMQRRPGTDILALTKKDLKANNCKKPCQKGCGVYCVVSESLVNNKPLSFGLRELGSILGGLFGRPFRRKSA
ncbi:MAG TPA: radical SAM protein [Spirochaetota bacterium]|nr:radical SAM protein [Spirochaetota bacterium]HPH02978.1 radical SAM protein [Spirochaetota bacterium]